MNTSNDPIFSLLDKFAFLPPAHNSRSFNHGRRCERGHTQLYTATYLLGVRLGQKRGCRPTPLCGLQCLTVTSGPNQLGNRQRRTSVACQQTTRHRTSVHDTQSISRLPSTPPSQWCASLQFFDAWKYGWTCCPVPRDLEDADRLQGPEAGCESRTRRLPIGLTVPVRFQRSSRQCPSAAAYSPVEKGSINRR